MWPLLVGTTGDQAETGSKTGTLYKQVQKILESAHKCWEVHKVHKKSPKCRQKYTVLWNFKVYEDPLGYDTSFVFPHYCAIKPLCKKSPTPSPKVNIFNQSGAKRETDFRSSLFWMVEKAQGERIIAFSNTFNVNGKRIQPFYELTTY